MNRTTATSYQTNGTAALAARSSRLTVIEGSRRAPRTMSEQPVQEERLTAGQIIKSIIIVGLFLAALAFTLVRTDARLDRSYRSAFASVQTTTITVHTGDSLWDIAEEHAPANADIESVVRWIRQQNNLDSALIVAGQTLVVPSS